jgi:hypothetical protein
MSISKSIELIDKMLSSAKLAWHYRVGLGEGALCSVIGWGTKLQAGKAMMNSLGFFNLPNPSSRTEAQGSIQLISGFNSRNLRRVKGRPARKAGNLSAICQPVV